MKPKYKVVTYDRYSCTVTSKIYKRKYDKGKIVKAAPDSPGLCVFKTRWRAEKFVRENETSHKILRVQTTGVGKKIKNLSFDSHSTKKLRSYFKLLNRIEDLREKFKSIPPTHKEKEKLYDLFCRLDTYAGSAPEGTYAYPALKVLN